MRTAKPYSLDQHFNPETTYQLIVFSDTHVSNFSSFFNENSFRRGVELMIRQREKFIDYLDKKFGIDGVQHTLPFVHLGDITDTGTFEEYMFARKLYEDAFGTFEIDYLKDILYVPGNHDSKNLGYMMFEDFFGNRNFKYERDKIVMLGLDSTVPDQNDGKLGLRAKEEIDKLVSYPTEYIIIVLFHHHLIPIPFTGRERSTISDSGDIIPSLFDSNVDIVLCGHRHIPNLYSLSNGQRNISVISAGTFSSNKTRGRSGHTFIEILIDQKTCMADVYVHPITKHSIHAEKNFVGHRFFDQIQGIKKLDLQQRPDYKIAVIADTHFSTTAEFQEEVFLAGQSMLNRENGLKLIIHAGNLTDDGYPESYALALQHLHNFSVPFIIVPGPRDLTPLGKELFIHQIGPLNPYHEDEQFYVFGVNTGSGKSGHIGRSQLQMLLNEKEMAGQDRLFIVAMHHSCLPLPKTPFKNVILDAGDAIRFFSKHEIPIVISGAEHISQAYQVDGSIFINVASFSSLKIKRWRMNTFIILNVYHDQQMLHVEEVSIHSGQRYPLGTFPLSDITIQRRS